MKPINDCLLVELDSSQYTNIATIDKEYKTQNSGTVLAVDNKDHEKLLGKKVFWPQYKEQPAAMNEDGKNISFIKYEDVMGYIE